MPRIFVSYRREDSAGYARGVNDSLAARFGSSNVFMDLGIRPGENFVDRIQGGVSACDVLIALIGRRWVSVTDSQGRRRLDDPDDFPRIEIGEALRRPDTVVIPVLVGGASMPEAHELPDDLQSLATRQALEIRDISWEYDLDRLIEAIETATGEAVPEATAGEQPGPVARRGKLIAAAGAACVAVAAVVALALGGTSSSDGDRMSQAQFRNKMDDLCAKYRTRSDKYNLPDLRRGSPQVRAVLDRVQADILSYARDLRAMKPPAALDSRFREFTSNIVNGTLTAVEYDRRYAQAAPATDAGDRAIRTRNRALVKEARSQLLRAGKLRSELGLPGCIEVPLYGT